MLRDVGVKPGKDDLPPPLRWEGEIWQWFWRLAEPAGMSGVMRPPRAAWLALIDRLGWCEDTAFALLREIEAELAKYKPGPAGD